MFLKKVSKHNKWLFLLMVLFIIGQLFINYKRGMVLSPFYHYGMYSGEMKPAATYGVYEVRVDKIFLKGTDFSSQQWDQIILPIKYFHSLDSMNKLYQKDVRRLMTVLSIPAKDSSFLVACDTVAFKRNYKNYLSNVLKKSIDSIDISYRNYDFSGQYLKPTSQVFSLAQLCN